ncbi:MAG: hypothetical protein KDN22_19390 [Verrucomicrobiae bacterium]|nr:hypothetical protein [Verrucomicrobiae bacterium]
MSVNQNQRSVFRALVVLAPVGAMVAGILLGWVTLLSGKAQPVLDSVVVSPSVSLGAGSDIDQNPVSSFLIPGDPVGSVRNAIQDKSLPDGFANFFALLPHFSAEELIKLLEQQDSDDESDGSPKLNNESLWLYIWGAAIDRLAEIQPEAALGFAGEIGQWAAPEYLLLSLAFRDPDLLFSALKDEEDETDKAKIQVALAASLAAVDPGEGLRILTDSGWVGDGFLEGMLGAGFFDLFSGTGEQFAELEGVLQSTASDASQRDAIFRHLFERWVKVAPDSALERLGDFSSGAISEEMDQALGTLAWRQPERLLALMEFRPDLDIPSASSAAVATALKRKFGSGETDQMLDWINAHVADANSRFAVAGRLDLSTDALVGFLEDADGRTLDALSITGLESTSLIVGDFFDKSGVDPETITEVAERLARRDLAGTLDIIAGITNSTVQAAAGKAALDTIGGSQAEEATRALAGRVTNETLAVAIGKWAERSPVDAMEWLSHDYDGFAFAEVVEKSGIIGAMAKSDPATAAEWLGTLRETKAYPQAATSYVNALASINPAAVEQFMQENLTGDALSAAAASYSEKIIEWDPLGALESSAVIPDAALRMQRMEQAVDAWGAYLPGGQPDIAKVIADLPVSEGEMGALIERSELRDTSRSEPSAK